MKIDVGENDEGAGPLGNTPLDAEVSEQRGNLKRAVQEALLIAELKDQTVLDVNSHELLRSPISPEEVEDWLKFFFRIGCGEKIMALIVNNVDTAGLFKFQKKVKSALFEILPPNFLLEHCEELRAIKRKYQEPIEEVSQGKRSLFHWTSDAALRRILKDRGLKASTEVDLKGVGTGSFEKHIGADGIFVTYGVPYENSGSSDPNLIIFPGELLHAPDTLCIYQELSLGYLQMNLEHIPSFGDEKLNAALEAASTLEEKTTLLRRYLLAFLVLLLSQGLVLPEEIESTSFFDYYEMSLRPTQKLFPQMLIVSEEPEYAFEQAQECWPEFAQKVPIVSVDSMKEALVELLGKLPDGTVCETLFVDAVNKRQIDLEKWRYRPE